MKPQHTPTPWHLDNESKTVVGADGIQICTPHGLRHPQPAINAAFIVRAVNCHEELVELVKMFRSDILMGGNEPHSNLIKRIELVIAKVEGR